MRSIRERLSAAAGTKCIICSYLASLPAAQRDEWREALAEPVNVIGHVVVARVLIEEGIPITEASVRRHRDYHGARP
jgi:hypothetical protein